jgi:hypothetical protein
MSLPYSALRVLDASQGYAGPYCGMLMAQHGAQVTKIEPPEGDWIRGMGTRHGEHTALDLAVNRGKRSIVIDMRAEGRACARAAPGGRLRRVHRELPPRRGRQARPRLHGIGGRDSEPRLPVDQRLRPDRARRRTARHRHGAAGLLRHDGAEPRRGRQPQPRRLPDRRCAVGAVCVPGAVGRALRAPGRRRRAPSRDQPDAVVRGVPGAEDHRVAARAGGRALAQRAGRHLPQQRRLDRTGPEQGNAVPLAGRGHRPRTTCWPTRASTASRPAHAICRPCCRPSKRRCSAPPRPNGCSALPRPTCCAAVSTASPSGWPNRRCRRWARCPKRRRRWAPSHCR